MARWEPDAPLRLIGAALDLFLEQGYEQTTVIQIAERAGLTKSTFFRHFPDKREVLFFGEHRLSEVLTGGIAAAPASADPLAAVGAGLRAAAVVFDDEMHETSVRRQTVIDANPELQEREALKRAALVARFADVLRARGVGDPTASVAAQLGSLAFSTGFRRWVADDNHEPFDAIVDATLDELALATAALSSSA